MNNNAELLQWAVENIKEWNDSFTHLRADRTGVLYTEGDGWEPADSDGVMWLTWSCGYEPLGWYAGNRPNKLLVITKQEWLDAKSNTSTMEETLKPPHKEWNIRHFRENKHVSKGYYSITILYREVGKNKYEYKLAVCNPKDQFERSKGIQAALAKDSYVISTSKEHLELSVVCHYALTNVSHGSKLHLFLLSIMSDIANIFN